MGERFTADTDGLDAAVAILTATEEAIDQLTVDLDRQVAVLQSQWDGLAAEAQAVAHQEWSRGTATMRAALADLRDAADRARRAYTVAAEANLAQWQQVAP